MEQIVFLGRGWWERFRADNYDHICDFMMDLGFSLKTAVKVALWAETALPGAKYPGRLPRGLRIYIVDGERGTELPWKRTSF